MTVNSFYFFLCPLVNSFYAAVIVGKRFTCDFWLFFREVLVLVIYSSGFIDVWIKFIVLNFRCIKFRFFTIFELVLILKKIKLS